MRFGKRCEKRRDWTEKKKHAGDAKDETNPRTQEQRRKRERRQLWLNGDSWRQDIGWREGPNTLCVPGDPKKG